MEPTPTSSLDPLYAAPVAAAPEATAATAATMRRRAGRLLGVSVIGFVIALVVMAITSSSTVGSLLLLLAAAIALVGAVHGVVAAVMGIGTASVGGSGLLASVGLTVANLLMMGLGAFSALLSSMAFTRGRQIRSAGRVLLPPVEAGAAWTDAGVASPIDIDDGATRAALAAQWRENGRTEHASVAAFARLTLDLMALGAPPSLVADANKDALDEIRHAELCFGLARELDGRSASPGAFPEAVMAPRRPRVRTLALAELAVDSLIDGALHEGVSARIIAKLARRCETPAIRIILKEIAADEGRHARHGWDVVRWCLEEGGAPVARALEGAVAALPRAMTSPMPEVARDGRWERWGIMGEALEADEFAATRADVVRRVGEAVGAGLAQTGLG